MDTVLNKTTFQLLHDVDGSRYPSESWLINPELSHLTNVQRKYWKIVKDSQTELNFGTNGNALVVVEMNANEKLVVDGVNYFKIYDYLKNPPRNVNIPPNDIDYDILGFYKKRIFVKGELIRVEYYSKFDLPSETYSDIILAEDRIYWRDSEIVKLRDMTITWYKLNDETGFTKATEKYYSQEEGIQEGEQRRNNVISKLKIDVIGLIAMTEMMTIIEAEEIGRLFLREYNEEINLYKEGDEELFNQVVANDSMHDFLNNFVPGTTYQVPAGTSGELMTVGLTIRQYILSSLYFDYTMNDIDNRNQGTN